MRVRPILLLAFVWSIAACEAASGRERPPLGDPPCLVLVTIDTLRADYLGVHGNPLPASPYLDELARSGIRFERAYATAPFTGPSHASILTSQHPSEHGVIFNGMRVESKISGDSWTLAEHLWWNGMETGAVVSAKPLSRRYGFWRGFESYKLILLNDHEDRGGEGARVTDAALGWVRSLHEDRPFFLWAHYFEPHLPYISRAEARAHVGAGDTPVRTMGAVPHLPRGVLDHAYSAEVYEADRQVAALLEGLRDIRPDDEIVVAITSDHGEYLGEHGLAGHWQLYDEVLHVPLIIAGNRVAAPEVRRSPVSLIDLAPTLLELMGMPELPTAQGRSLVRRVSDLEQHPVYAEWRNHELVRPEHEREPVDFMVSAQSQRYKLLRSVLSPEQHTMLFDLEDDPDEERDLSEAEPVLHDGMTRLLEHHIEDDLSSGLLGVDDLELDAKTMQMLKELGYVQ